MNLIVPIPDKLASRLSEYGADLERRALEAFLAEEYRAGRVETDDLREALGFDVIDQVDGFLKAHGVYEPCTVEDVHRDVATLVRLGF